MFYLFFSAKLDIFFSKSNLEISCPKTACSAGIEIVLLGEKETAPKGEEKG